jgi:hypothetical protein
MNSLVQNYDTFQDISAWNKGCLGRFDDFLGYPSDTVCTDFGKKFEANVE